MNELKILFETVESNKSLAKESWSEKFKNITLGIVGIISAIVIPVAGYWFTQNQNDKEIEKSYIELGVKILAQSPNKGNQNVREWAVALINKHSDIKLEGEAKNDVINNVPLYSSDGKVNTDNILRKKLEYDSTKDKPLGFAVSKFSNFWDSATIMETKVKFVFIKATEGVNSKDESCGQNVILAKKYNLRYSLYHFYYPNKSPESQAKNFNEELIKYGSTLPVMIDLEYMPFQKIQNKEFYINSVLKFISLLNIKDNNDIVIYTFPTFALENLDKRFNRFKLCIASYKKHFNPKNGINGIWDKADYWNFSGDSNTTLFVSNE
jgi:hypothetical protein